MPKSKAQQRQLHQELERRLQATRAAQRRTAVQRARREKAKKIWQRSEAKIRAEHDLAEKKFWARINALENARNKKIESMKRFNRNYKKRQKERKEFKEQQRRARLRLPQYPSRTKTSKRTFNWPTRYKGKGAYACGVADGIALALS